MSSESHEDETAEPRRGFLGRASTIAMLAGLGVGYGGLAAVAGRFLYPSRAPDRSWLLAARLEGFRAGDSKSFQVPGGELVNIVRRKEAGDAGDFIALSSTCPHLGCRVHWEPHNERFFCPCHNGVFSPAGVATEGPPAQAGQALSTYPLRVENGLLFIDVPMLAQRESDAIEPKRAGHDPCLPCMEREDDRA